MPLPRRENPGGHIESVFALSLSENVVVFKSERTTDGTHSCLDYAVRVSCTLGPHIYPSVGYWVPFILTGFYHNLL